MPLCQLAGYHLPGSFVSRHSDILSPNMKLRSFAVSLLSFCRRHPWSLLGLIVLLGILSIWSRSWVSDENPIDSQFSADSSVFATIGIQDYYGAFSLPNPGGPTPKSQSARLQWAEVANSRNIRSLDLGETPGSDNTSSLACRLSPDSSFAAVVAQGRLQCINLKTAQSTTLSSERENVTSFAWLGNNEVIYAAHVADSGDTSTRSFYRQSLAQSPQSRRLLCQQSGVFQAFGYVRRPIAPCFMTEVFSPQGGYVLFTNHAWQGELFLLNVRGGTVSTIRAKGEAQSTSLDQRVAWKMDDSAALCLIDNASPVPGAVLIDTATGTADDLSSDLARCYKEKVWLGSPFWTPDGKFCVFNGGFNVEPLLICPRPWSVFSLRTKAATSPASDSLGWSPLPGTIYHRDDLVCYDGTKLRTQQYNEVLSPNGQFVARMYRNGGFSIQKSGIPDKWIRK